MNTTPSQAFRLGSATNGATRDTTSANLSRQGVALPVAARTLGVSLRTVQRRLDRGELGFIERDGKRLVLLESGATPRDSDATRDTFVVSRDTTARQVDATPGNGAGLSSERESELKEEIRFLRGLVEQRDRDAAELRAALREALKIAPRQFEAGRDEQSATNAQNGQQSGAANIEAPKPSANGEDELDPEQLRELCFRVFDRR